MDPNGSIRSIGGSTRTFRTQGDGVSLVYFKQLDRLYAALGARYCALVNRNRTFLQYEAMQPIPKF